MTSKAVSILSRAVRALRVQLQMTQVQFAAELGKTPTTIVRYETNRPPTGKALADLAQLADGKGASHLAEVFQIAYEMSARGVLPDTIEDRLSDGSHILSFGNSPGQTPSQIVDRFTNPDWKSAFSDDAVWALYSDDVYSGAPGGDAVRPLTEAERRHVHALLSLMRETPSDRRDALLDVINAALKSYLSK